MSFSAEVKEELSRHIPSARHCQIAEITAIISMCGRILIGEDDRLSVVVQTENLAVARKYFTLIRKTFNITNDFTPEEEQQIREENQWCMDNL